MFDFDKIVDRRGVNSVKWDVDAGELPMWVADMDFDACPAIKEAIKKRLDRGAFGYQFVGDEWYKAISDWWGTRHGFKIEKEWLCFCTGVVPAITSMVKSLSNVGDEVVLLPPVYDIFYNSIINGKRIPKECDLVFDGEAYSIDFIDLEKKLSDQKATLLILCNPHNPIGKIWSKGELSEIGDLCKKYGVTVISDEIHCDLTEVGYEYVPFASASEVCKDISVTAISASKAFNIAGLQSAAVFSANAKLINTVTEWLNHDELAEPNSFATCATVAAFTEGGAWLDELNAYVSQNRKVLREYLAENVPQLKAIEQKATYLAWVNVSAVTADAAVFCDKLRAKTGLFVTAGNRYHGNGKEFIRINLACPRSRLVDGISRLANFVKDYKE